MSKLTSFTFLSLNGFYKGPDEDTSWHRHGGEEIKYSEESLENESILLFGRKTYDMMSGFWPTQMAGEMFPIVASGMNKAEKYVFSRTLKVANWNNTNIVADNLVDEVKRMKETKVKDLTILGSGSIVTQLTDARLIDSYQIMIDPIALGEGVPLFTGIKNKLDLRLVSSRIFKTNGIVLLTYERQVI